MSTNILAIRTVAGRANGSGTFQHMQTAVQFYNMVINVVSMIKSQGGVVSCAQVLIVEVETKGGRDVLLLGDNALMRALNSPESDGVPQIPLTGLPPPC